MSERLESSGREFDLEKQLHLLRQDRELTIMELAEFKDREAQLRRLNETLMKALTEEKPSNALLHEIKLIIEQCGGTEKERALEAELERMRREKDRQVEDRVQAIIKDGKLGNPIGKCTKCQEYLDKIAKLEAEVKRISIVIVTLTDEKGRLNEELSLATSEITTLEIKKTDLQAQLRRMGESYQQQLVKMKEFRKKEQNFQQAEAVSKLEAEWRDKIERAELTNRQQLDALKVELENHYQAVLDNKVSQISNDYEQLFQTKMMELEKRHRAETDKLNLQLSSISRRNDLDEMSKRNSRLTPTKYRGPLENNGGLANCHLPRFSHDENDPGDDYQSVKQAKSRTIYAQEQFGDRQGQMKDQIQSIISGLARNKQNTSQVQYVNAMGSNLNGFAPSANSEYSNFSIKDSLNRPNTILESHLRLKKN